MERFLSSNNGMVIGSKQSISEFFNGQCDRRVGEQGGTAALQMSAVTTGLWFIISGFEPALKVEWEAFMSIRNEVHFYHRMHALSVSHSVTGRHINKP